MRNIGSALTGCYRGCTEMGGSVPRRALPVLVLGLTAGLTAVAIAFLPETLYFSVIEYSTAEDIRFTLLKNGELDQSSCEQGTRQVARAVRASCPQCKIAERCVRGLDAERRKILSRELLSTPSVRLPWGKLTMTISAVDPQLALGVCRQMEVQTASEPVDQRLTCYPPLAAR